ncbi:hypothetical protein R3I94_019882 [Phoxinus phoxinus]|uniref:DBF4-type domain-containing protein n=1 Tax=Phoxinus phoxinus TaxID=58324 RepID=A0AAN9CG89_9TELE
MTGDLFGGVRSQSFYLHDVKRHQSATLTDIIIRLGGKVDSFLTKDVNVVVTGTKEAHSDLPVDSSCTAGGKQSGTPKRPVCGSRGRALLEKAIHSNEKYQSSVLASARSWGVKVYSVDEFLKFINHLNQKMRTAKKKSSKLTALHVKAGVLKGPYLKVEDFSRKFRPFYAQTLSFPMMIYSGKYSPFEPLIPRQSGRSKDEDPSKDNFRKKEEPTSSCQKLQTVPLTASATPKGPTKKSSGYCECCHMPYKDQYEHLQSEMHRSFIQNDSNYAVVDQLTADMNAGFVCKPNQEVDPTLIKSSADFPPLHLNHLTEMQNAVSEDEKFLQTPLVEVCGHVPPITDIFSSALDNRENFPEPSHSPSGQQNEISHLDRIQNNCPDPLDHDKLGLYISCTTKVQDFQSGVLCMDIVPHQFFSKSQSIENKLKSLSSVTPSETQSKMLILSSSRDDKIPCTISVDDYVPETQDRCESGHGRLALHMSESIAGAVLNTVCSQNQKQNRDQGSKMWSNSPKMLLHEREDCTSESCGQFVMENRKLSLTKRSLKLAQDIVGSPEFGLSYFSFPHLLPFPHLSDYQFSIVNFKKRCRSFTPSPKLAKRRKICQSEKPKPSWNRSAPRIREYSSVLSTISFLPVPKVGFATKINSRTGGALPETHESSLKESSFAKQIPTQPSLKYFTPPNTHHLSQVDQQDNDASQTCVHVEQAHESFPIKDPVESRVTTYSSDSDPPQLVPFFHEDHRLQYRQYHDPPELFPEDTSHTSVSKASNGSFQSHSGASVCIESALLPNLTWSTASSESDWDSGLLSWIATAVPLQAKGGHDDLGQLLEKPHTAMQDGSYTSRLCSILQPS